jgi:hypothetical protein
VWSDYAGFGPYVHCVKLGALDEEDKKGLAPDIHIYTQSKAEWVVLPEGIIQSEEYYEMEEVWPKESLERIGALREKIGKWRADVTVFWRGEVEFVQGEELEKIMGKL